MTKAEQSMAKFSDKIVIVTGGAGAMGAATSLLFAAQGATVIVADVAEEKGRAIAKEAGGGSIFSRLDVSSEDNWRQLGREVIERFGKVDILVNNAGMLHFALLVDTELADFERLLRVNLVGCFLGMKTIGPLMLQRRKGAIVNISSVSGMEGANCLSAYAATKWGVRGLTRVAALEFGHQGVRVNSVHPGSVNTPMTNPNNMPLDELNKDYADVSLQRVAQPNEIAGVTVFLASDDASYINGSEFVVDGGLLAGHYLTGYPGAPGR
jgi:3alpha(or 20beta)-hydroxysteroid dehydrogenase